MRTPLLISLVLILAGCGSAYQTTKIREGVKDGARVRVMEVTPETVLAANRDAYVPRGLPAAFSDTAGLHGTRGVGSRLPEPVNLASSRGEAPRTMVPPAPADSPYQIGVGDVLLLATRNPGTTAAELTGLLAAENRRQGYTVQDDGAIAIPDVGRVRVAGMTIEEAEAEMFSRLLAQQMDSSFSLEVAEFNSRRVSIGGAVVKPGVVPVTLTPLTLDAALAGVGGVAVADRSSAVIRIYRDGTLYQIPVEEFLTRPSYQKTRLVDGDSVFVDTEYDLVRAEAWFSEQITLNNARIATRQAEISVLSQEIALRRGELEEQRQTFTARSELGAEKRDYVYLTGELERQGRWALPYGNTASIADALFDQGGVSRKTGNPRQIYVLRGSSDPREFGALTAWHLDAGSASGLMLATRMELRPDDVIFVAEQPVTRWNRVIDQISPSLIAIPLDNATTQ